MGRNPLWYREYCRKTIKEIAFNKYVDTLGGKPTLTAGDKEQFYEDVLSYLSYKSIFEGREIANRLGINASTTVNKDELNRSIADAMWGAQDTGEVGSMLVEPSVNKRVSPATELGIAELYQKGAFINGREVRGYFEKIDAGYGVIRTFPLARCDRDAFCTHRTINELGLADGDYVVARAKYAEELKCFYVYHVESINGIGVDDFNKLTAPRPRLDACDPEKLTFVGDTPDGLGAYINAITPLAVGQSLLISYSGTPTGPDNFLNLTAALKDTADFDDVVMLCLGEREKNGIKSRPFVKSDGFVPAGDDERAAYVAKRAADFVRGEASRGKNMCLVVNALFPIAGKSGLCEYIMSSAVSYAQGGSVTVVCFVDRDVAGGCYGRVKRLADGELHLDYYAFLDSFDADVSGSYSLGTAILGNKGKHVITALRRYLRERGPIAARRLVSAQKSYNALCDSVLSTEEYDVDEKFTR